MALPVFAITAELPRITVCVLWEVPAFAGWIFLYFRIKILHREAQKLAVLKEQKYVRKGNICFFDYGIL